MNYITTVDGTEYNIRVEPGKLTVNDEPYEIDFQDLPREGLVSLLLNHRSVEGIVEERDGVKEVLIWGELYSVSVQDERSFRLSQARGDAAGPGGEAVVRSPMPGNIVKVPVVPGETVHKKQTVVILESMKMENELKSPRDGVVLRVSVAVGAAVEKGQVLIVIGDPPEA